MDVNATEKFTKIPADWSDQYNHLKMTCAERNKEALKLESDKRDDIMKRVESRLKRIGNSLMPGKPSVKPNQPISPIGSNL